MTGLADAVLVLHALLVLFVVVGLAAVWVGAAFGQSWARNRVFRLTHLAAISVVAALAALDLPCPLTLLEDWLRPGANGSGGFVQRWVSALLYYDLPLWVFTASYVAFLLAVLLTWWRIPPRPGRALS